MSKPRYRDPVRQTGRTSKLMLAAGENAVYVVRNNSYYYNMLKLHLNRPDLVVRTAEFIFGNGCERMRGVKADIVLDHYVQDTMNEYEADAWAYFCSRREKFARK